MLDLKKLEKQLDKALEKETPESMNAWLRGKRKVDPDFYLGEGELIDLEFEHCTVVKSTVTEIVYSFECTKSNIIGANLDKAA